MDRFKKDDYVLYYEKGHGVFSVGRVISSESITNDNERYREVEIIVPPEKGIYIDAGSLKQLVQINMYFASTIKVPYLTMKHVNDVIYILKEKQKQAKN